MNKKSEKMKRNTKSNNQELKKVKYWTSRQKDSRGRINRRTLCVRCVCTLVHRALYADSVTKQISGGLNVSRIFIKISQRLHKNTLTSIIIITTKVIRVAARLFVSFSFGFRFRLCNSNESQTHTHAHSKYKQQTIQSKWMEMKTNSHNKNGNGRTVLIQKIRGDFRAN